MRYYLIYKTINKINGKYYIGSHETSNKNDSYLGSGVTLKKAIKKYGKKNFVRDILYECNSYEEMCQLEKKMVEVAIQDEMSYNIGPGGAGGWNYVNSLKLNSGANNVMHRPDVKVKMASAIKQNWKLRPEAYLQISLNNLRKANNIGRICSTKHRKRISESNKIRWRKNKDSWRDKLSSIFEIVSPEGQKFTTNRLQEFCEKNFLPYTTIWKSSLTEMPIKKGKAKGWKCKKISLN